MCTHWSGSNYSKGEGSAYGESEGWSDCRSTGINRTKSISVGTPIESVSFWTSSNDATAQPNSRVQHATEALEKEIRTLAKSLPVADFVKVRIRVEDLFDSILLAGLR
jgi:hypothetical protein